MVAGLPDISFDDTKLPCTMEQLREEVLPLLDATDRQLLDLLLLPTDNRNLLALLKDKDAPTAAGGLYAADQLAGLIAGVREGDPDAGHRMPAYMRDFIEAFDTLRPEEWIMAEDMLWGYYYAYAMQSRNHFVSEWFGFNLNTNNLLAAWTARKYRMDVSRVVVGDTEICRQLKTSTARDFDVADEIDCFEQIQHVASMEDWVERERKLDQLRWNQLDAMTEFDYFTIERIFVFAVKLQLLQRWVALDKDKGQAKFRQIIQSLKEEVKIPVG